MSGLQDVNRPDLIPEARVEIFRRWRWEATNDLRQRGVVHDAAACDVDQRGRRLHLRQLGRANGVV